MTIFKEKVYPPQKLRDVKEIDGVKFNLSLLKSFLWLEHFERIDNRPIHIPNQTRTKTTYP